MGKNYCDNEDAWRNDRPEENGRTPSVSTCVTHAQDFIEQKKTYKLYINHVRGHLGKGFKWVYDSTEDFGSSCAGTGVYGTSQELYDRVVAEGKWALSEKVRDDEAFSKRMQELYNQHLEEKEEANNEEI
jgi:hypothetical protein